MDIEWHLIERAYKKDGIDAALAELDRQGYRIVKKEPGRDDQERKLWTPARLDAKQEPVHSGPGGLISAKPINPASAE